LTFVKLLSTTYYNVTVITVVTSHNQRGRQMLETPVETDEPTDPDPEPTPEPEEEPDDQTCP